MIQKNIQRVVLDELSKVVKPYKCRIFSLLNTLSTLLDTDSKKLQCDLENPVISDIDKENLIASYLKTHTIEPDIFDTA